MRPGQDSMHVYRYTRPLLIAVLLLPLLPALTTSLLYLLAGASGCALETYQPCMPGGIDVSAAYAISVDALRAAANASISGFLLLYLLLIGALAQLTTHGFRSRVVRTFAAMLGVGLMPFILGVTSAAFAPFHRCAAMIDTLGPCDELGWLAGIAFYGNAFFDWLANTAVPLAALVTILVALTMGYRALIGRLVRFCTPARD